MRIIFIRHGEPDYEHDCLTETGKKQAQATALRLDGENISEIYASPMGRAQQTAQCTAQRLGLPITTLDYMHEISWGGPGIPENGHPWTLSERMIDEENTDLCAIDWRSHPYFLDNIAQDYYDRITRRFDELLEGYGYRHEGARFFCGEKADGRTIALFSHGGSGACVLAHLLGLPFPYMCTVLPYWFTSVSVLSFPARPGRYVHPVLELFNDTAHLQGLAEGPVFQQQPD